MVLLAGVKWIKVNVLGPAEVHSRTDLSRQLKPACILRIPTAGLVASMSLPAAAAAAIMTVMMTPTKILLSTLVLSR